MNDYIAACAVNSKCTFLSRFVFNLSNRLIYYPLFVVSVKLFGSLEKELESYLVFPYKNIQPYVNKD